MLGIGHIIKLLDVSQYVSVMRRTRCSISSPAPSVFIEFAPNLEVLSPNKFSRPKGASLRHMKLSMHMRGDCVISVFRLG